MITWDRKSPEKDCWSGHFRNTLMGVVLAWVLQVMIVNLKGCSGCGIPHIDRSVAVIACALEITLASSSWLHLKYLQPHSSVVPLLRLLSTEGRDKKLNNYRKQLLCGRKKSQRTIYCCMRFALFYIRVYMCTLSSDDPSGAQLRILRNDLVTDLNPIYFSPLRATARHCELVTIGFPLPMTCVGSFSRVPPQGVFTLLI